MKRIAVMAAACVLLVGCSSPSQIGADEDCFKAVDALYTAVTARSPALLDQCQNRLNALRSANKLPESARKELAGIEAKAANGKWESAASRNKFPLHKVFPRRFRVDDEYFEAQAFNAEMKDCGCRSCSSGAQYAMARMRRSGRDRSGGDRICWPQDAARDPSLESRQVKLANREVPENGRNPTGL